MLEYLHLKNVGPAPEMELKLGRRLNLLTGDNGLGKSFLLDVAWWALTRRWPADVNPDITSGLMARPSAPGEATIEFAFPAKSKKRHQYESTFDRQEQAWTGPKGRPANPGLVIYAQVDGGFSVWDPARNYWRTKGNVDVQERRPAFVFTPRQVWEGLPESGPKLCNGLIADWALWQKEGGQLFDMLKLVLLAISPSAAEQLTPGELRKISLDDVRLVPTIRMPYGEDVPVLVASAGIRRALALAYLLIWAWDEHQSASNLIEQPPTNQVTFLIDEIESHLHPRWQRSIVDSLLTLMRTMHRQAAVQLICATHSPLVMASVEPIFDASIDRWFDLDLISSTKGGPMVVKLEDRPFIRRGDASRWLTSEAFNLGSSYSIAAEKVLEEASRALSDDAFDKARAKRLDAKLRKVLGDTDPFWMRWRFVGEKRGWLS